MKGKAVEYVYAELQEVVSCDDPRNREMTGSHVVALRLNLGEPATSVVIFTMRHARELRDDLNRILAEHAALTGDPEP